MHSAVGQNSLLCGKTWLVILTDLDYITLLLFTQSISSYFCGQALMIESTKSVFITHFSEPLTAMAGMERLSFILTQLSVQEVAQKRLLTQLFLLFALRQDFTSWLGVILNSQVSCLSLLSTCEITGISHHTQQEKKGFFSFYCMHAHKQAFLV